MSTSLDEIEVLWPEDGQHLQPPLFLKLQEVTGWEGHIWPRIPSDYEGWIGGVYQGRRMRDGTLVQIAAMWQAGGRPEPRFGRTYQLLK